MPFGKKLKKSFHKLTAKPQSIGGIVGHGYPYVVGQSVVRGAKAAATVLDDTGIWKKPKNEPLPKLPPPDFETYWKQYSGWMQNINRRTEGELSSVRARLSAAGASPDLIKMQTEHLESQRTREIGDITAGQTYRFLQEGFDIASGARVNPYNTAMPGTSPAVAGTADAEGNVTGGSPAQFTTAANLSAYYTATYGQLATPEDRVAQGRLNANAAAGGGSSGGTANTTNPSPALYGFNSSTEAGFWS